LTQSRLDVELEKIPRNLFADILRMLADLRPPPMALSSSQTTGEVPPDDRQFHFPSQNGGFCPSSKLGNARSSLLRGAGEDNQLGFRRAPL
jgi:hypothetical protein